jgi:ubiquinone biosynthesis protein
MISGITNFRGNVRRVDQIVRILGKYGLGNLIGEKTPDFIQRRFVSSEGIAVRDYPFEVRVRMALTELGTTFIKVGQMMSQRPDMVGPELAAQLESLQADTPPDPPTLVRATIEEELGQPPDAIFTLFNQLALASASVGQVHLAELKDGSQVVVKVQHAGIEPKVKSDLNLMMSLAQAAESNSREFAQYRPTATVAEFQRSLMRELDFHVELNNMVQFARNFADDPDVHFPIAYPEFSSKRVLTMERLDGYSIARRDRMLADGIDITAFAELFANTMLSMVFRDGFYHADPHPGNIFVLPGGRLGMLDSGKIGRVDEKTQDDFINIVTAFINSDVDSLTDELVRMCETPANFNRSAYRADVSEFVGEFADVPGGLDLGPAFTAMFGIIRKHKLVVPARVNMLLLVIVQTEGTARFLDPDFDLTEALQGFGLDLLQRRYSPKRLGRDALRSVREWQRLIDALPRESLQLLERTRSGDLRFSVEQPSLSGPLNRLAYGIIVAALLLGSTLMWGMAAPPTLWGVSVIGFLGLLVGVLLGAHLLFLIWRSSI